MCGIMQLTKDRQRKEKKERRAQEGEKERERDRKRGRMSSLSEREESLGRFQEGSQLFPSQGTHK